jgi:molybdopterin synthase catalytic subunit
MIAIVPHIDLAAAYSYLQAPGAGGTALFLGTVRDHAQGKEVVKLAFEAYEPMALS